MLLGRGVMVLGALPLPKKMLGLPTLPEASTVTNPLSYLGHRCFPKARLAVRLFGTTRIFGMLGRVNVLVCGAWIVYDIMVLGFRVFSCLQRV